jgi:hypothetical protein
MVNKVSGPVETITHSEVKAAITRAKSGKAAGHSGGVVKMLKASGAVRVKWANGLYNPIAQVRKKQEWMKKCMKNISVCGFLTAHRHNLGH